MSERGEIAVVLIVTLFIAVFIDQITALKMAAGMVLLWVFGERTAVFEGIPEAVLAGAGKAFGPGVSRRAAEEPRGREGEKSLARLVRPGRPDLTEQ
jgi:hypothetical protein